MNRSLKATDLGAFFTSVGWRSLGFRQGARIYQPGPLVLGSVMVLRAAAFSWGHSPHLLSHFCPALLHVLGLQ